MEVYNRVNRKKRNPHAFSNSQLREQSPAWRAGKLVYGDAGSSSAAVLDPRGGLNSTGIYYQPTTAVSAGSTGDAHVGPPVLRSDILGTLPTNGALRNDDTALAILNTPAKAAISAPASIFELSTPPNNKRAMDSMRDVVPPPQKRSKAAPQIEEEDAGIVAPSADLALGKEVLQDVREHPRHRHQTHPQQRKREPENLHPVLPAVAAPPLMLSDALKPLFSASVNDDPATQKFYATYGPVPRPLFPLKSAEQPREVTTDLEPKDVRDMSMVAYALFPAFATSVDRVFSSTPRSGSSSKAMYQRMLSAWKDLERVDTDLLKHIDSFDYDGQAHRDDLQSFMTYNYALLNQMVMLRVMAIFDVAADNISTALASVYAAKSDIVDIWNHDKGASADTLHPAQLWIELLLRMKSFADVSSRVTAYAIDSTMRPFISTMLAIDSLTRLERHHNALSELSDDVMQEMMQESIALFGPSGKDLVASLCDIAKTNADQFAAVLTGKVTLSLRANKDAIDEYLASLRTTSLDELSADLRAGVRAATDEFVALFGESAKITFSTSSSIRSTLTKIDSFGKSGMFSSGVKRVKNAFRTVTGGNQDLTPEGDVQARTVAIGTDEPAPADDGGAQRAEPHVESEDLVQPNAGEADAVMAQDIPAGADLEEAGLSAAGDAAEEELTTTFIGSLLASDAAGPLGVALDVLVFAGPFVYEIIRHKLDQKHLKQAVAASDHTVVPAVSQMVMEAVFGKAREKRLLARGSGASPPRGTREHAQRVVDDAAALVLGPGGDIKTQEQANEWSARVRSMYAGMGNKITEKLTARKPFTYADVVDGLELGGVSTVDMDIRTNPMFIASEMVFNPNAPDFVDDYIKAIKGEPTETATVAHGPDVRGQLEEKFKDDQPQLAKAEQEGERILRKTVRNAIWIEPIVVMGIMDKWAKAL